MKQFKVWVPTNLDFGPGTFKRIGDIAKQYGHKALIVTYPLVEPLAAYINLALDLLDNAGVKTVLYDKVEPNPLSTTVDSGALLARQEHCDLVIAIGGGSAIDCGKCIALMAVNAGSIWDYMPLAGGPRKIPRDALPIIAVETTSGTGSGLNQNAVATNPKTNEKPGMGYSMLHPRATIVDPELMLGLPSKVTASTGIDVFFHALEGYIHVGAQPFTDLLCLEAMRIVIANLKGVIQNGKDLELRAAMAWACSMAGIVIDISGVVLLHAIGHPISAYHNVPHGETLVALAIPFMELTYKANPAKFAKIAAILGADVAGASETEAAKASVDGLAGFLKDVGLTMTLGDLGADPKLIPDYVQNCLQTMQGCISGQPTPVTAEIITELYQKAFRK